MAVKRILHIAPINFAGVPLAMVRAERSLGLDSRLITMAPNTQGREEDICLHLPLARFSGLGLLKRLTMPSRSYSVTNRIPEHRKMPPVWQVSRPVQWMFSMRELLWEPVISRRTREGKWMEADAVQLDGGLDFYRDGRWLRQFKDHGGKVICCYTGSDLRVRGLVPAVDALSDVNVTVEFDHLQLYPGIHHVPFPLDVTGMKPALPHEEGPVRIGHAPTRRKAKGSRRIIDVLLRLEALYPVKMVLIENRPHAEALDMKRSCHIFVDQLGELGYGLNGVEALAMGIPTCTSLAAGFAKVYADHPFAEVNEDNLEMVLTDLIKDPDRRKDLSERGLIWVRTYHDSRAVVRRIHRLAELI